MKIGKKKKIIFIILGICLIISLLLLCVFHDNKVETKSSKTETKEEKNTTKNDKINDKEETKKEETKVNEEKVEQKEDTKETNNSNENSSQTTKNTTSQSTSNNNQQTNQNTTNKQNTNTQTTPKTSNTPKQDPNAVDTTHPLYSRHHGQITHSDFGICNQAGKEKMLSDPTVERWSCVEVWAVGDYVLGYYLELHYK